MNRTLFSIVIFAVAGFPRSAIAQVKPDQAPSLPAPLTMRDAVEMALRGNPSLQGAQADLRAARAQERTSQAMAGPQLSASTFFTTGDMQGMVTSSPGVSPQATIVAPAQRSADLNLSLMAPLYTGGKLYQAIRAASNQYNAARHSVDEARVDIALRTREAYLRVLLSMQMENAAAAREQADEALVATTRTLYEQGKGIEAAVSRVQADLADAVKARTAAHNDGVKSLLDLKAVMGINLDSSIIVADALSYTQMEGDLPKLLDVAAKARPELKAVHDRLSAAQSLEHSSAGSLGPQIYGVAMADGFTSRTNGVGSGYTVGITMSVPLLDGGQRRAELSQQRAMRERAETDVRNTELTVGVQVRQAWLDLDTATRNYETARVALEAAQKAYDVMALRVANQKSLLVEQLDALAALTQARANVAQGLFEHELAIARLNRAVGRE